ncbi:hypothetical protein IFM12275_14540 [Nocardia sputorum]|uniref:CsbD family protein n=1 Tax=Nocardia sputorum TaxID=2984338 RepID=A0ABM8CYL3_9NOCA|nr:hypothetical protein IFM12275_14540 [Nocardia sputorum]BDU00115.1 hypothetical protein IFM12276_31430 [Nocardia sputorum]
MSHGLTKVLGRIVEDLKRMTRRGAEGVADMPRGAARFVRHDVDVKVQADQLGGREVDKAGETLAAPEHRCRLPGGRDHFGAVLP